MLKLKCLQNNNDWVPDSPMFPAGFVQPILFQKQAQRSLVLLASMPWETRGQHRASCLHLAGEAQHPAASIATDPQYCVERSETLSVWPGHICARTCQSDRGSCFGIPIVQRTQPIPPVCYVGSLISQTRYQASTPDSVGNDEITLSRSGTNGLVACPNLELWREDF